MSLKESIFEKFGYLQKSTSFGDWLLKDRAQQLGDPIDYVFNSGPKHPTGAALLFGLHLGHRA